jgi:hypothetical protein
MAKLKSRCRTAEIDPRSEFIANIDWVMSKAQEQGLD